MYKVGLIVKRDDVVKDVIVDVNDESTIAELSESLNRALNATAEAREVYIPRLGSAPNPRSQVGLLQLRWGDVVELRVDAGECRGTGAAALEVIQTNRVKTEIELSKGTHLIGRDLPLGVVLLTDPTISARHAILEASGSELMVTDLGSTNGTYVDGVEIAHPTGLAEGQVLELGDTKVRVLRVCSAQGGEASTALSMSQHLNYAEGVLQFNRQPRVLTDDPRRSIELPTPPERPAKRRLPVAMVLAPLAIAGALYFLTSRSGNASSSSYYLLFALLSPVLAVVNVLDDRRSGRKTFRKTSRAFREGLLALETEGEGCRSETAAWSQMNWPAPDVLESMAMSAHAGLWWRRKFDPDFLDVRIGMGELVPGSTVNYRRGGDPELDAFAMQVVETLERPISDPVVVSLTAGTVLGIHGPSEAVDALASGIILQVACEQSPADVSISLLAPRSEAQFGPLKWLPHISQDASGTPGLAFSEIAAEKVFDRLLEIARRRCETQPLGVQDTFTQHILVAIKPPLSVLRSELAELLAISKSARMSVIWICSSRGELPGECTVVIEVDGASAQARVEQVSMSPMSVRSVAPELLSPTQLLPIALCLAPLRDVTDRGDDSEMPVRIPLLQLLNAEDVASKDVLERWEHADNGLRAIIGSDASGASHLDLDEDGPHALVAGTTGSGKSELLRTYIASLALAYPPERVTFLLVDYKGGAAFDACRFLPHTVGLVTDLDGQLAERALRSLNAELRRRERQITRDGGATDLKSLRLIQPMDAPPSLLVVIDEFAFLARDLPKFVDQLVDVAQRGRSLGVHLILATQRPSGIVSAQIQGNTSLRIALRVADPQDSVDIIDRPDAASISPSLKGRAYIRAGHGRIRSIQTAYVSGGSAGPTQTASRRVATFRVDRQLYDNLSEIPFGDGVTDLGRIVDATRSAAVARGLPLPAPPWCEPLPPVVDLDEVLGRGAPVQGLNVTLGLADLPDEQRQAPWRVDLNALANVLVIGGSGSGKTTFLKTLTLALANVSDNSRLHVYGFDFGNGGLGDLKGLPNWGGAAGVRDLELVERLVSQLEEEITHRGESSIPTTHVGAPNILVLIDNWSALAASLLPIELMQIMERLVRVIVDGRSYGIHFAITSERPGGIPAQVMSSMGEVITLRLLNSQDYLSLGHAELVKSRELVPGRGFTSKGLEVQVAISSSRGHTLSPGMLQAAESTGGAEVPTLRLLPTHVGYSEFGRAATLNEVPIGMLESGRVACVNCERQPLFLVAGPPASGRSTALATLALGVTASGSLSEATLLAMRPTPLTDLEIWQDVRVGEAKIAEYLASNDAEVSTDRQIRLLVLDDGDELAEPGATLSLRLEKIVKRARDTGVIFLASMSSYRAQRALSSWTGMMRSNQHGLLLAPSVEGGEIFHTRIPRQLAQSPPPPGRGVLIEPGRQSRIQVAQP